MGAGLERQTLRRRLPGKVLGAARSIPSTYIARDIDDRLFEADFDALGRTFPPSPWRRQLEALLPGPLDHAGRRPAEPGLRQDLDRRRGPRARRGHRLSAGQFFLTRLHGPHVRALEPRIRGRRAASRSRPRRSARPMSTRSVGLDRTLVVLSADHGGPEAPEYHGGSSAWTPVALPSTGSPPSSPLPSGARGALRPQRSDRRSQPPVPLSGSRARSRRRDWTIAEVERFVAAELTKYPRASPTP